ncbi:MAG: hypothetical protein KC468_11985 [Myxococcales bacterium]|nr:hypothetical protein [Myxococcales bacterium]
MKMNLDFNVGWCLGATLALALAACGDDEGTATGTGTETETETEGGATSTGEPTTAGPETTGTMTDASGSETDGETMATTQGVTTGVGCEPPEIACDDLCVDPQNDPDHCGGCGVVCQPGESCLEGSCAALCDGSTPDLCDGDCTNTDTDPEHCGGCGNACQADEQCLGGACAALCDGGQQYCDGQCVDVGVDPQNCGGCGVMCEQSEQCLGGACAPLCDVGQEYCDGVCADVDVDPLNCGGCGLACALDEQCVDGLCAPVCPDGLDYCAMDCVDAQTDENHCGGCDMPCAQGQVCTGGSCGEPGILVIGSFGVVTPLQGAGYTVTQIDWPNALPLIDIDQFQIILLGRYYFNWPANMSPEIYAALDAYSQAGGNIVTEYDGISVFLSGYHPTFRELNGAPAPMGWFAGEVGSGWNLASGTPVNQTLPNDPLFDNVNDPFSAGGATQFFMTVYNQDAAQLETLATYLGDGSQNFPAEELEGILRGRRCGGNILFANFDYQDDASNPGFGDFIPNLIKAVAGPTSDAVVDVCP